MKVTCETIQNNVQYPRLMIGVDSKRIVLMTSTNTGVCVCNPQANIHGIGYYSDEWLMNDFKPYDNTVTLQND